MTSFLAEESSASKPAEIGAMTFQDQVQSRPEQLTVGRSAFSAFS